MPRSLPKSTLVEHARNYVKTWNGRLPALAHQTGLGYQWLMKFQHGGFNDVGCAKIEVLLRHEGRLRLPKAETQQ